MDNSRSYGNVPIVQTHETINEGTTFFHTRFWMSSYLVPTALTAVVFPIFPHDKETLSHISHRIKSRRLGPHTHQGPHQTGFSRSVKMDFDMEWFGAMYSIDSSVMQTSSADFIRGQHMQLLASGLNMTITQKIVEAIMSKPNIYDLYRKMLETGVQQRYTKEVIDTLVMDLRERVPGFIGGQGCSSQVLDRNADMYRNIAPSISSFLMTADEILHTMKVADTLVPTFFMMGSSTARSINVTVTAERQPSETSSRAIAVYLNKMNTTEDISLAAMKTVTLGQITTGVSLIPIEPIREDTGVINLLADTMTTGLMYPVRIPYKKHLPIALEQFENDAGSFRPAVIVSIPDFERRQNVDLRFEHPLTISENEFEGTTVTVGVNKEIVATKPGEPGETEVNAILTQKQAASYHIGTRLFKYVNDKTYLPLNFLVVAARNRFWVDQTKAPPRFDETFCAATDMLNYYFLEHKRKFYHTLDIAPTEIELFPDTDDTKTKTLKRVKDLEHFKQRHDILLRTGIGPRIKVDNSTGNAIKYDHLVKNMYIIDTCFRGNVAAAPRDDNIESLDRSLGFILQSDTDAPNARSENLACVHKDLQDTLTDGDLFKSTYHALQFILDAIFITDNVESNVLSFPPSVRVKMGNNEFITPADPNYDIIDIIQPKIAINTEAIVYGIGGEDTGVVALGQQKIDRFMVHNEQHEEVHITARMLVAIKEPDHLVIVPDAAYRGYLSGASARVYGSDSFDSNYATTFTDRPSAGLRRAKTGKLNTADVVAVVAPKYVKYRDSHTFKVKDVMEEIRNSNSTFPDFDVLSPSDIKHVRQFSNINAQMTDKPIQPIYKPYCVFLSNGAPSFALFGNTLSKKFTTKDELINTDITLTPITTKQLPCLIWRHMPNKTVADVRALNKLGKTFSEFDLQAIKDRQSATNSETVSRGPLRYITAETGMDTFCGRPVTATVQMVQTQ